MKHRIFAALAAVCLSLTVAGCSVDTLLNKIQAAITKGDEVVLANQSVFINACNAGAVAHAQLRAQVDAGIIKLSAKDDANEQALYEQGLVVCSSVPNDLQTLLKKIPAIQAWINQVSILAGKVN